jgi:hypothetical protein
VQNPIGRVLISLAAIVSPHDVVLHIGISDSAAGRLTLEQAYDYIKTNTENHTDYYLYFSAGRYMASCNFSDGVSPFWNISIHYMAEASGEPVVLWTGKEREQRMIHSGINRLTFKDVNIENTNLTVQSCNAVSFERVAFEGKKVFNSGKMTLKSSIIHTVFFIGFTSLTLIDTKGSLKTIFSKSTEDLIVYVSIILTIETC